jgi:hypothetical protein
MDEHGDARGARREMIGRAAAEVPANGWREAADARCDPSPQPSPRTRGEGERRRPRPPTSTATATATPTTTTAPTSPASFMGAPLPPRPPRRYG